MFNPERTKKKEKKEKKEETFHIALTAKECDALFELIKEKLEEVKKDEC